MEISERLKKIADLVPKCVCVCDVGTDHAYIPIYLAKKNVADKIIATDISKSVVERAERNVRLSSLTDKIECRQSDGLTNVKENVDVIICSGLGGMLMIHILSTDPEIVSNAERLILQPQKDNDKVRRYIHKIGFQITEEYFFKDLNKFYNIMVCTPENSAPCSHSYTENDYLFGKLDIMRGRDIFKEFTEQNLSTVNKIVSDHEKNFDKTELLLKKAKYEEILKCLQQWDL